MTSPLFILGASGHGREVAATAELLGGRDQAWIVDGFLDDSMATPGVAVGALPVKGTLGYLSDRPARLLLGVGYPETKLRVLRRVPPECQDWPLLVHPSAVVGPRVRIERGAFVQAGCVLTCDIVIGEFATINCGVTINHDVRIERLSTLSPGAHVGGNVSIGEGAFIGIGASVRQGVVVGDWSVIGAGAAVVSDVAPNTVVAGVPARVLEIRSVGWQDAHRPPESAPGPLS